VDTFRSQSLKYCIGFTFLIGVILIYAGIWSLGSGIGSSHILVSSLNRTVWYALGFIVLGTLISFILRDRAVIVAAWALSLSLGCAIFSILTGLSNPAGVLVFLVPTLFTIILLSWKQAAFFLFLVIFSSLFLNIVEYGRTFYQLEVVIPILIIMSVTILLELIFNELRGNYEWYQQRYQSALIN
jgi:hypothetical protein